MAASTLTQNCASSHVAVVAQNTMPNDKYGKSATCVHSESDGAECEP